MSKQKRILPSVAILAAVFVLMTAFGYLSAYLQTYDTVGILATISYVIQQLLVNLPIFVALGIAFLRLQKKGIGAALSTMIVLVPFCFFYQLCLTFLDYYFLQNDLLGTSLLLGLMNGLLAGILSSAILFLLLFFVAYLLFLRGKKGFDGESRRYAALSAMLTLLLYGLIEETAALLSHLSENFWIIYASEILSFVLFCLLRVGVAAFGFLVVSQTERIYVKITSREQMKS